MEKEQKKINEQFWKEEIKKHWKVFSLGVAAIVGLCIVAVYVLIWHVQTSPYGNFGTATLNQWSLEWVVGFVIVLILWELLFVGAPGGLIFGLGWYFWWKRLPSEEQAKFNERPSKNKKARGAGGGFGCFLFIAFCIFIAINGNYSAPFGSQPYSYWVFAYLQTIGWLLIILGIPAAVIGLVFLMRWLKKPST